MSHLHGHPLTDEEQNTNGRLGDGSSSTTSSLIPQQFPQMLLQVLPIILRACVLRRISEVKMIFIYPFLLLTHKFQWGLDVFGYFERRTPLVIMKTHLTGSTKKSTAR